MYKEVSKLVLFHDLGEDSILFRLAGIYEEYENQTTAKAALVTRIYGEMKRLLDLATQYGFDENLWHNYLAYLLISNENSFSLTCEKVGASEGTVNVFARKDFAIFKKLFDFDFSAMERDLDIDCFTTISNYHAIAKKEQMYNKNVSRKVQSISRQIEGAKDENEIFDIVTAFYAAYGVGMFGLNKAFRIRSVPLAMHRGDGSRSVPLAMHRGDGSRSVPLAMHRGDDSRSVPLGFAGGETISGGTPEGLVFTPINNTDEVMLDDLIGYEIQKKKLIDNTEAFVKGRKANNVLLFGDSGTGKSTSIKAIINQYYNQGLRMIEIYKHQFHCLSSVISHIKNRNYRFIIYMDDLSFEEFEIEYKYLKAVIEGGLEVRPDNVLIYATSNRRHLIKETWNDRDDVVQDNGMHRSDTMQEKLSLVNRFGVTISYSKPSQKEYFQIVTELAQRCPEITLSGEQLLREANKWELSHGGISGRTAQQFIDYLAGQA